MLCRLLTIRLTIRLLFLHTSLIAMGSGCTTIHANETDNNWCRKINSAGTQYDCTKAAAAPSVCSTVEFIFMERTSGSFKINVTVDLSGPRTVDNVEFEDKDGLLKSSSNCRPTKESPWCSVDDATFDTSYTVVALYNSYDSRDGCPCGEGSNYVKFKTISNSSNSAGSRGSTPAVVTAIASATTESTSDNLVISTKSTSAYPGVTPTGSSVSVTGTVTTTFSTDTTSASSFPATSNDPTTSFSADSTSASTFSPTPEDSSSSLPTYIIAVTASTVSIVCISLVLITLFVFSKRHCKRGQRLVKLRVPVFPRKCPPIRSVRDPTVYLSHVQYPDGQNQRLQRLCEHLSEDGVKCMSSMLNANEIASSGYRKITELMEKANFIILCLDAEFYANWTQRTGHVGFSALQHEIEHIKVIEHKQNQYNRLILVLMDNEQEEMMPNDQVLKGTFLYKMPQDKETLLFRIRGQNLHESSKNHDAIEHCSAETAV
eukprot:m.310463 g.310463  ORF g.310463 m.310463 type:complete len:488 (+) comp51799_c0_seq1:37-1500(+)